MKPLRFVASDAVRDGHCVVAFAARECWVGRFEDIPDHDADKVFVSPADLAKIRLTVTAEGE